MFVELMPLLAGRTVLITVAKVDDKTLRVNVIPTQAKAEENPALTTPLTFTGPPEELDAELGKHLAGYVQTHQQTANTLAEAKTTMEAAAKAAQEEAKRKAEERKKAIQKPSATTTPASSAPAEPAPASASTGHTWVVPTSSARTCSNPIKRRTRTLMESKVLNRYFEFHGQRLPDPDPKLPVEDVRSPLRAPIPGHRHGGHHRAGGMSETSCAISSREPSAQRDNQ